MEANDNIVKKIVNGYWLNIFLAKLINTKVTTRIGKIVRAASIHLKRLRQLLPIRVVYNLLQRYLKNLRLVQTPERRKYLQPSILPLQTNGLLQHLKVFLLLQ